MFASDSTGFLFPYWLTQPYEEPLIPGDLRQPQAIVSDKD